MTHDRARSEAWDTALRSLGFALLLQFTFLCVCKWAQGTPEQIWWVSHVSLLTTAAGLIGRRPWLVSAALTNVLLLHLLWLVDLGTWLLIGDFPFQVTTHMANASEATWVATAHHFYLTPALLLLFLREPQYRLESFLLACSIFLLLTLFCCLSLPQPANINCAFCVPAGITLCGADWLNSVPRTYYLTALNLAVGVFVFVPTAILLTAIARWRNVNDNVFGAGLPTSPDPARHARRRVSRPRRGSGPQVS